MRTSGKPKNLKQNNTRVVLDFIRERETVPIAEISDEIGLSKTTVKKIVDSLLAKNLIFSNGKGESTIEGGKKPEIYSFNKNYGYILSLHITPGAIIAVTTDLRANITYYSKNTLNSERDLQDVIGRLVEIIQSYSGMKEANGNEKLIGIVIALPGLVDSSTGVSIYSPHFHSWGINVPFLTLLRENLGKIGDIPIFIGNVNRYQAIAEKEKGIAGGVDNFLIIEANEECLGAGMILHGELTVGNHSLSGEIGHMTLNSHDGPICNCGNKGCFEALVSAKRILAMAREAYPTRKDSRLFQDTDPDSITLASVCENAALGDALCQELVDDAAGWFAIGLSNIIMMNDPELIVIQGVYIKAGTFFLDRLREKLRNLGLPDVEKCTRIEYSQMNEERSVIGGAAFVISDFFSQRLVF